MKKFTIESTTAGVTLRVKATTTYPKQSGMKKQIAVTVYAGGSDALAKEVVKDLKAAKVEKHEFKSVIGSETVVLSRYTDSHFTTSKNGVTTKIHSAAYHRLLEGFREAPEWVEIG